MCIDVEGQRGFQQAAAKRQIQGQSFSLMVSRESNRAPHGIAGVLARFYPAFTSMLSRLQLNLYFLTEPVRRKRLSQDGPPNGIDTFCAKDERRVA
jgi:hypothetical protein